LEELSQITLIRIFENDVKCFASPKTPIISYEVWIGSDLIECLRQKIESVVARKKDLLARRNDS
jgi:hypothetical protein